MKEHKCECGFKAKSKFGLSVHKRNCKKEETKPKVVKAENRFKEDFLNLFKNPFIQRRLSKMINSMQYVNNGHAKSEMELFAASILYILSIEPKETREEIIKVLNEFGKEKDPMQVIKEKCLGTG